jgi:hypothetical protein
MDTRIESLGYSGVPIDCTAEEYHAGLRGQIQSAAATWIDQSQNVRAMMALNEVKRLDEAYGVPPLFAASDVTARSGT